MKRITILVSSLIMLATAIYSIAQQSGGTFVPVTDTMLENPDPADWLMWRRTLNGWGYSPLDQINTTNVRNLRMVWTRGIGPGIQEATPLVYHGVMYLPNPSDLIQAINAATGDLSGNTNDSGRRTSAGFCPSRRVSTGILQSTGTISSTRALTITCTRWMPRPASSPGKIASSI